VDYSLLLRLLSEKHSVSEITRRARGCYSRPRFIAAFLPQGPWKFQSALDSRQTHEAQLKACVLLLRFPAPPSPPKLPEVWHPPPPASTEINLGSYAFLERRTRSRCRGCTGPAPAASRTDGRSRPQQGFRKARGGEALQVKTRRASQNSLCCAGTPALRLEPLAVSESAPDNVFSSGSAGLTRSRTGHPAAGSRRLCSARGGCHPCSTPRGCRSPGAALHLARDCRQLADRVPRPRL